MVRDAFAVQDVKHLIGKMRTKRSVDTGWTKDENMAKGREKVPSSTMGAGLMP